MRKDSWIRLQSLLSQAIELGDRYEERQLRLAMSDCDDIDYPRSRDAGSAVTRAEASTRAAKRRGIL